MTLSIYPSLHTEIHIGLELNGFNYSRVKHCVSACQT